MQTECQYKTFAFLCSYTWRVLDGAIVKECRDVASPDSLIAKLEYAPVSTEYENASLKLEQLMLYLQKRYQIIVAWAPHNHNGQDRDSLEKQGLQKVYEGSAKHRLLMRLGCIQPHES